MPIELDHHLTPIEIVHNGHTMQINYRPDSGITVGGKRYELLQFHFHSPSEHSVAGRWAAMEVHFVHQRADGELAVVGVLIEVGQENMALREPWAIMPRKAGRPRLEEQVLINARNLTAARHRRLPHRPGHRRPFAAHRRADRPRLEEIT